MRKTYLMLLALMLTMGVTNAMGQKIYQAKLDKSMFTAWDGVGADAKQTEPQSYVGKEGVTQDFACETNYYKSLGAGALVFGNSNVYSRWYANLTGTKTITFIGTAGLQLRVLMNRPDAEAGAEDPNGGTTLEKNVTIGSNGEVSLDVSDLEYVHLNAIKLGWGSPAGVIKKIMLEGTVKPVTGVLSVINNGNAEGEDLASFPVSFDGPNNGDQAPDKPEVVDEGGNKVFKVTAHTNPTESWHTQFYVKADEVMAKGSKWVMKMSIKASENARVTTSAQAQPRQWKGGMIDEFGVTTEWQNLTWKGEIGVDDFQSVAFDLNNGDEEVTNTKGDGTAMISRGITFYFDNIEFGYDLGGNDPMDDLAVEYGADVVRVKLNGMTNMKKLVGENTRIIYPNDCATVTWNGKKCSVLSVEGKNDGNLYIFLDEIEDGGSFDADDAEVVVGFKNPADEALHLTFTDGDWAGVDVPDFSGMISVYNDDLAMGDDYYVSYLWGSAQLVSIDPEKGSFQLPVDTKNFTVTFNQAVVASSVKATFNKKPMTVSPAEGSAKTFTLTRAEDAAVEGQTTLVITNAVAEKSEFDLDDAIVAEYSFGPVVIDPNDKQEDIYVSNFTNSGDNANGAGWRTNADAGGLQDASAGSGCNVRHDKAGFAADVIYVAQRGTATGGVALYGLVEGYELQLAPKTYHLTLGVAQWDAYENARALTAQVLPLEAVSAEDGTILDEDAILAEVRKNVEPELNNSKDATLFDLPFTVEQAGNYVIRLVPSKPDGSFNGYSDGCAIANVKVEYIPNVMGITEINAINASLEKAKTARQDASDERYDGAAFTAVEATIAKYDGKIGEMTAPTAFAKGVEELDAAAAAINAHKKLCDEYDALPEQAYTIFVNNKNSKFAPTEYYATIKSMVEKYCTVETQEAVDEEGNTISMEVLVAHKIIKDDDELNAAKNELSSAIDLANNMFFEGKSHNWYGGGDRTKGYAALHERLRRGVELLKTLGLGDSEEVALADAELGDNDAIANAIVKRATIAILSDLASSESTLFEPQVNEETEEIVIPSYDLSVFMKNPNIYSPAYSTELPGWISARGNTWVFPAWGADHTAETPYPEDCQIHAGWHPSGYPMAEQTIENLPAGIYSIKIDGSDNNSTVSEGTYGYVKTSDTPEMGADDTLDPDLHFAGYVACSGTIEDIEVVDGKLTVGFSYGPGSQAFINDVEIYMTNFIADHNYAADLATDINNAKAAKVVRIQLFDLNGKAIPSAKKGVVFVKKTMSDGSVVVDKVLK